MLFVLSSAVRLHANPFKDCVLRTTPRLQNKAKGLVAELRRLEPKDIRKQLHVNEALAKQYQTHLGDFEGKQPIPACALYDSKLFNNFGAAHFDEDDAAWTNDHVRLFSGLYGCLRPYDEVQPLSLPVTLSSKLTNSKGKFLRDYWREPITAHLEETLQNMPMPVVVNCASEEDADAFDIERLPEGTTMTTVKFSMSDNGSAAEAMGEFLRWAMETRCYTVEELLEFKGFGVEDSDNALYRISTKAAKERDTITFEAVKGDTGYVGKMQESGVSKTKFIRQEASGKTKYLRTEIKQSIEKSEKKKRGKFKVF